MRAPRLSGVGIVVVVATLLAVYDLLAGPTIVMAGLIAVGPCLAAISAGRRGVLAVGAYTIALILLVSWPAQIWWTRQQLLYLVAAVAVTVLSGVIADRQERQHQSLLLLRSREIEARRSGEESQRIAWYSRSLLEASADPLVTIDSNGTITDVNAAAAAATGVPRDELLNTDFADYFTDPDKARQGYQLAFAMESVTDYELTIRGRDGHLTDVLYNASTYRDDTGAVLGVFAAARDVTALKRAEANYRGLLESAPDAVLVFGDDGTIQIVNHQTEVLFGYLRDEVVGQSIEMLVPERLRVGRLDLRGSYLAAPDRRSLDLRRELTGRRKDGSEFPAEVSLAPVQMDLGTSMSAAVRDVTQQHLARAEMMRANQAKLEFLSRMSHELRTPLNAILGFGQLLELDDLSPDQRDGVQHIVGAGRHLLELINEVLDISQVESGTMRLSMEPVYVPDVTDEAIGMIRPLADQRGINIAVDRIGTAHVRADRQRFKQVVVNLLANAVKYNREGGDVRIEGEMLDSGRFRLTVTDSGFGLTEEECGRLFQPFQRLDAERYGVEGTGLGLMLTKQLMTAMGGQVGVRSRRGSGSAFFVELPVAEPPSVAAPTPELPAALSAPARDLTVLYVEDNLSNVRLVEKVLARRPAVTLMVAMQGQVALDMAPEHHPDLILLDLHLPDISGEEVLRRLKEDARTADIPVVMLSADATLGRLDRLVAEGGAASHLTKPFDIPQLLALIDDLGAEQRAVGDPRLPEVGSDPVGLSG